MSDPAQLGCTCGAAPAAGLDDGTATRWWTPAPARMTTYSSPWRPVAAEPLWCPANAPDVSFLFRMCLAPERGLTEQDYEAAATALGVEVAAIKAVAEVETKGSAFDDSGRPTILYERHYFKRISGGRFDTTHPDISGPAYGPGKYGPKSKQYDRLALAFALDPWAALQSVSWGRFQVMGEHYATLGYASPQHMALAFSQSEKSHLDAFVAYVRASKSGLKALKQKNWARFAEAYNGSGYARFHYDTQMATAYAQHAPKPAAKPAGTAAPARTVAPGPGRLP